VPDPQLNGRYIGLTILVDGVRVLRYFAPNVLKISAAGLLWQILLVAV
jgi:hypothetical protein